MPYMRLWAGLCAVIAGSFAVLGYFGRELYREAPPIPDRVVTTGGRVIYTGDDIDDPWGRLCHRRTAKQQRGAQTHSRTA